MVNAGSLKTGAKFTAGGKVWTVSATQEIPGEVYATTLEGSGQVPAGVESGCYFRADEEVDAHAEGCCCDACNPEYHPQACPCCGGEAKRDERPLASMTPAELREIGAAAARAFPGLFQGQG